MWRRSNEVEEQARVRGRDKREGKKEREKRRRETSRRPMARDLRNGSFFSSLFIPALPFPSSPTSSPIILLPLLLRSSSSSSTRWLHACTYACSVFFVRWLFSFLSAVRLFLPVASSLVLLAFPHVHLLLHRRRTFVHVPVHSFVKSPLASSGHVAHAATKRGRNGRPIMVAQVKMANDSFTFPFYPLYQFFHLLFFVFPFQMLTIFSFREERYRGITMSVKLRLMKLQFDRFTIHRFQSRPKRAGSAPFRSRGRESDWSIARQIYLAHADPFVSAYLRVAGWNERRNCKGKLTTTRPSNLAFAYFAIMESGSAISSR